MARAPDWWDLSGGLARQTVAHNVTINNLLPGIFDSDAQRRHIQGMLEQDGKSFDEIWQARAMRQSGETIWPAGRTRRVLRISLLGTCRIRYRAEHIDRRGKLSRDVLTARAERT